jgi:hypothetical protein
MKGTKKLTESINEICEPRIIMSKINEEKSCFLPQFFVGGSFYLFPIKTLFKSPFSLDNK